MGARAIARLGASGDATRSAAPRKEIQMKAIGKALALGAFSLLCGAALSGGARAATCHELVAGGGYACTSVSGGSSGKFGMRFDATGSSVSTLGTEFRCFCDSTGERVAKL